MIGQYISHYRILEKLGEGGMGVVYKAHDTTLDRPVAMKFLAPYLTSDLNEKERFYHEARAAAALTHPNIAVVHEIGEHEGQLFIAMEYIEGQSLRNIVGAYGDTPMSIPKVIDIAIQICEGLTAAHKRDIVHRDIKSDNIMVTKDGQVKIMDFGLAKVKGATKLTKAGSTIGTAAYMSPEQAKGIEVDHRSDIFSLGVVLYELLTGTLPFRGEHHAAILYSIVNEEPQPVARFNEKVTPEMERIVAKALEKDREDRYQHVDELLSDLRRERKKLEYAKTGSVISQPVSPSRPTAVLRRRWWKIAGGIVGLCLIAIIAWYFLHPKSMPTSSNSKSIAVLPFKNLSDSREDEYFSDGITDDIIAQLSKIADLKVISRTATMRYKQSDKGPKEIGKELNVGTILEGSVRRSGNQVRIVAQLIDARNEGHLWADTYDKDMTQVFAIQSDVAQRIAASLKAKLSPGEKERIGKKQTESPEAYELYLKGRFYWNKRRLDDLKTAIDYFEQAIRKDPNYALAYAGLAATYVLMPWYGAAAGNWFANAEKTADKALEIDSTLAEGHAVLGLIAEDHHYDWAGAEKHFRQAIELDPGYATAHQWYSETLRYLGRFDEALAEIKRALELDPLSLIIITNMGELLYTMRQYDKAIEQYKNTLALDPTFAWAHFGLAYVYQVQGRFDEAIVEAEKARSLGGDNHYSLAALGWIYAGAGRRTEALRVLDELRRLSDHGVSVSYGIALTYYRLGEKDKAFEWLEKAYQDREVWLPSLGTDPLWDDLRSDPRCIALLKKMGLRK